LNSIRQAKYKGKPILRIGKAEVFKTKLTEEENQKYKIQNNSFEGFKELAKLSEMKDKQIRPLFLKYCCSGIYDYKRFNCPMDFLITVLDKNIKRAKPISKISINQFFNNNVKIKGANDRQIDDIYELANKLIHFKVSIKKLMKRDKDDDSEKIKTEEIRIIELIKSKTINIHTVMAIIQRAYKKR